ncbi:MAG: hypothetical protein HN549_06465 [Proteobacteria bacterium]|nr:hypothetical protein [Pseudomonadota bacterium]
MSETSGNLLLTEIEALAAQLEDLVATGNHLRSENQKLRLVEQTLSSENEDLINRNLEAKKRIDVVVDRLRTAQTS